MQAIIQLHWRYDKGVVLMPEETIVDYSHSISLGNISSQCTANAIIFTLAMSVPWNVKQQMVDMYGCCLNAMNTTSIDENDIHHLVTRYDLWTACDVETPGF